MNKKKQIGSHKLNTIIRSVNTANGYSKTEEFKRPNHPDFMTSSELKTAEWSGVRQNMVSREWEFWICGEIKKRVHENEVLKDPLALSHAHLQLFGFSPEKKNVIQGPS